jgi:predicted enzyme related to lactoylglutathione lyase
MIVSWKLTALMLAIASVAQAQGDAKDRHGVFTGEIKSVIYVTDVEASMPFYRDVLGFEFLRFSEHEGRIYYAEMLAAGIKFGLHEPMRPEQESKVGEVRLYFRVKDVAAHHARVLARGGEPGDLYKTKWMDMLLVEDPDGNEISFAFTDPDTHAVFPWNTRGGAADVESNADVDEILRLHREVLEAHKNDDVDLWLSARADRVTMVSRGEVLFPTKEENRPRIEAYLEAAEFEEYRDLIDPIVRVSDDGTLGWLVCQVEIVGTRANDEGERERIDSIWAWIELYEKIEGRWYRTGNVSNMKPSEN